MTDTAHTMSSWPYEVQNIKSRNNKQADRVMILTGGGEVKA